MIFILFRHRDTDTKIENFLMLSFVSSKYFGKVLIVSQFTLFGSLKKGNKPDFSKSMPAAAAKTMYETFVDGMRKMYDCKGIKGVDKVKTGRFQHYMRVSLVNDGPVTLVIDSEDRRKNHTRNE